MDMSMDAESMAMTFFSNTLTPLFSKAWSPKTTGQYAGTCIFLIILAIVYRGLYAFRSRVENRWVAQALQRRYVVVVDRLPESERIGKDVDAMSAVLSSNGVEENVKVVHRPHQGTQPWRFSVDLPRGLLVTVLSGVGYLLYVPSHS